jgi:hypothetical protein
MISCTCTWNRGLLLANSDESRWLQFSIGKGSNHRRLLWWPRVARSVSLRICQYWWVNIGWKLA